MKQGQREADKVNQIKQMRALKAQHLQQHTAEWPAMLQARLCTVYTVSRESKLKPATVNFLPAQVQIKGQQTTCGLRNKRLHTVFVLSSCGVILWVAKVTHTPSLRQCLLFVMLLPCLLSISASLCSPLCCISITSNSSFIHFFLQWDSYRTGMTPQKNTTSNLRYRSVLLKSVPGLCGAFFFFFLHHATQPNIKVDKQMHWRQTTKLNPMQKAFFCMYFLFFLAHLRLNTGLI